MTFILFFAIKPAMTSKALNTQQNVTGINDNTLPRCVVELWENSQLICHDHLIANKKLPGAWVFLMSTPGFNMVCMKYTMVTIEE